MTWWKLNITRKELTVQPSHSKHQCRSKPATTVRIRGLHACSFQLRFHNLQHFLLFGRFAPRFTLRTWSLKRSMYLEKMHVGAKFGARSTILVVFILEDALSVWTNLGEHLLFVWLCSSNLKTDTRRIRLDELSSVVRRSRRIKEDCSSWRGMRLGLVFTLQTHNQTNNKYSPKFVQTDNASSSIKTAKIMLRAPNLAPTCIFSRYIDFLRLQVRSVNWGKNRPKSNECCRLWSLSVESYRQVTPVHM